MDSIVESARKFRVDPYKKIQNRLISKKVVCSQSWSPKNCRKFLKNRFFRNHDFFENYENPLKIEKSRFRKKFWKFFKNLIFQKISKIFEDQLWEDLTFFVFNRFWISFFIDRSELPWRTRFFEPKVFKKHRKKVARAPVTNRQIPGSVSLF